MPELPIHRLVNAHSNPLEVVKRKFREVNQLAIGHPASAVVFIYCAALPRKAGGSPF